MTPSKKTSLIATLTATAGLTTGMALSNFSDDNLIRLPDIVEQQNQHFSQTKKYEQILKGGDKPSDAANKAKKPNFPGNIRVDVYDGPNGSGYTIIEEFPDREIHVSYGPEAASRSKVIIKSTSTTTPTSTPNAI